MRVVQKGRWRYMRAVVLSSCVLWADCASLPRWPGCWLSSCLSEGSRLSRYNSARAAPRPSFDGFRFQGVTSMRRVHTFLFTFPTLLPCLGTLQNTGLTATALTA